jgi:hypothetical protein
MWPSLLLAAAASAATPTPTLTPPCLPLPEVRAAVAQAGGKAVSAGLTGDGRMAIVFANPETGDWFLALVTPDGQACLAIDGHDWEQERSPPPGDPV